MPVMMEKLYDALRAAGIAEDKARDAAVEAAGHETRFSAIEGRLVTLEGRTTALEARMTGLEDRMTMLMWGLGINLTLMAIVLAKLFTLR